MRSVFAVLSLMVPLSLTGCAATKAPDVPAPAETPATTSPAPAVAVNAIEAPKTLERPSGAKVWIHTVGDLRIHTYMAPFEAFANTTHVVEGATALVVIDPQMTKASAADARAYVDSLAKPIERLIISHAHPDHYLGVAAAWEDVSTHALDGTIQEIEKTGEDTRKARVAMFPAGWLSDHVTPPKVVLIPGKSTIDGVDYLFERFLSAEHHEQLVVRLPDHNVTVAQDLVYTAVHPVITDRAAIESWGTHIDTLLSSGDTELVLAGHGPPTDASGLTAMKTYLSRSNTLLGEGATAESFKADIMKAFPDRGGEGFVDFSVYFLFPAK